MPKTSHLIGLLLGTEEDWPRAFETLLGRLGPVKDASGTSHDVTVERITIEPFDLRDKPRYDLVVDRLAYWYYLPREWLKKVALMDDVYLLNSPFTFQSMEKHAAYCAMLRLGLKVPQTVLVPHKNPPDNARFAYTAAKYNQPFDLEQIAEKIGYPLFMKPYDGGQWVGVSHIKDPAELKRAYDTSGQRLMHLQAAVDGFDVFARSLSIGAETMVMKFRPDLPMHDRYAVAHDFLVTRDGRRGAHHQPPDQRVLPLGVQLLRDARARDRGAPDRLRQRVARRGGHQPALLLPVGDEGAAAVVRVLRRDRAPRADRPRHAALLRDRRPRGPQLRGEARGLPQARRRVLRGRALPGLLRQPRCRTSTSWCHDWIDSQDFDDLLVETVRDHVPAATSRSSSSRTSAA